MGRLDCQSGAWTKTSASVNKASILGAPSKFRNYLVCQSSGGYTKYVLQLVHYKVGSGVQYAYAGELGNNISLRSIGYDLGGSVVHELNLGGFTCGTTHYDTMLANGLTFD